jgi:ubiquinone/menaquinone biosynthesis C-methylase UbiE
MADKHTAFVGSIPPIYDRCLGPLLFHGFADDIVARLPAKTRLRVLETACGTGIVTERLIQRLRGAGTVIATDLNEAMVNHARVRLAGASVEWRQADATNLSFPDESFDAVVCQFGVMFFPDKLKGAREALRVLRPGGVFLFNTWDAMEHNPIVRITHETVATFFPDDPPAFYRVPFSFHDAGTIREVLERAGFDAMEGRRVETTGTSPSAEDAAVGLIDGNPIYGEIMARRPDALESVKAAVATNIRAELGDRPVRCPLRALVFRATRPARSSPSR